MAAEVFALLERPGEWHLERAVQLASACAAAHELEVRNANGRTVLAAILTARDISEVRPCPLWHV